MTATETQSPPIGHLLLRDGHSVPIAGLAPDQLKQARRATHEREGVDLKHTSGLNAIVHCLGFDGDFGDYKNKHWPKVQRFMEEHGLKEYRNLFEVPSTPIGFSIIKNRRRALADRLFFGPRPLPEQVFTGFGHDWDAWWAARDKASGFHWSPKDYEFVPRSLEEARTWLFTPGGGFLTELANFTGDQLLAPRERAGADFHIYRTPSMTQEDWDRDLAQMQVIGRVLRWVLAQSPEGWLEILPQSESLVLLKGPDGAFDFLWRNCRSEPPPAQQDPPFPMLQPQDLPSSLLGQIDFKTWSYYRLSSWDEKDRHEAEKHYWASGGQYGRGFYPGADVVLKRYLRHKGVYGARSAIPAGGARPADWHVVVGTSGGDLLVSDLVEISEMKEMMAETGYPDRRTGDLWEPGNGDDPEHLPTAATWYDAQAFCAWMEHRLGCAVRLPTPAEYKSWFPRHGAEHPGQTIDQIAPGVVERLEPWGGVEGVPERCRFLPDLRWIDGPGGLRTLHAWDFAEWTQNGHAMSTTIHGGMARKSWGAYKKVKIGFRVVIETDDSQG